MLIRSAQTGPPNDRKSRLICVHYEHTSWPVPLCTRQAALHTSFLSRQGDVIASFSFGTWTVQTKFFGEKFMHVILNLTLFIFVSLLNILKTS